MKTSSQAAAAAASGSSQAAAAYGSSQAAAASGSSQVEVAAAAAVYRLLRTQIAPIAGIVMIPAANTARTRFLKNLCSVLVVQFWLMAAIVAMAAMVHPVERFFTSGASGAVLTCFIVILVTPLIVLFKYRSNSNLLILLTLFYSLTITESESSSTAGIAVTKVTPFIQFFVQIMVSFYFLVIAKGYDYGYHVIITFPFFFDCHHMLKIYLTFPFIYTCLNLLMIYQIVQMFFLKGRGAKIIYAFLATIVFLRYIVLHTYNKSMVSALSLYVDIINVFVAWLSIFRALYRGMHRVLNLYSWTKIST